MDPTTALRNLRAAFARMVDLGDAGDAASLDFEGAACNARDAFEALDGWLSGGGFLPEQWQDRCVRDVPGRMCGRCGASVKGGK